MALCFPYQRHQYHWYHKGWYIPSFRESSSGGGRSYQGVTLDSSIVIFFSLLYFLEVLVRGNEATTSDANSNTN